MEFALAKVHGGGRSLRLDPSASPFAHCGVKRTIRTVSDSCNLELGCCFPDTVATAPKQQIRRTQVSFAETVVASEIPSPWSYDEVQQQWYTREHLVAIQRECTETVHFILSGCSLPDAYCKRGLEPKFRNSPSFLESSETIVAAVLDKQVDMWCEEVEDPAKSLAEFYSRMSRPHMLAATVLGHSDWKSVEDEFQ
eukprot:Nitzschia sp. Nitz4//scaffold105_size73764//6300//6887//NITZ4_005669-RA/size73764-processed-gene-0.87-mRNA-1//-1//CDS//3329532426//5527//frame0